MAIEQFAQFFEDLFHLSTLIFTLSFVALLLTAVEPEVIAIVATIVGLGMITVTYHGFEWLHPRGDEVAERLHRLRASHHFGALLAGVTVHLASIAYLHFDDYAVLASISTLLVSTVSFTALFATREDAEPIAFVVSMHCAIASGELGFGTHWVQALFPLIPLAPALVLLFGVQEGRLYRFTKPTLPF